MEKYAHVTFFSTEAGKPFAQTIPCAVPQVPTDLQPEMSAIEVTDRLLEAMEEDAPDVIILNFANGDSRSYRIFEAAVVRWRRSTSDVEDRPGHPDRGVSPCRPTTATWRMIDRSMAVSYRPRPTRQ